MALRRRQAPAGRRRFAAGFAVVLVGVTLVVASPSVADREDVLRGRQSDVAGALRSADQDLHESSARLISSTRAARLVQRRLGAARSHLASTRGALATAQVLDETMQAELGVAESRLSTAERALAEGQLAVIGAEDDLATFVVNSYQYGNPSLASLGAVLAGGSVMDVGERLGLVETVAGAQSATIDDLDAATTFLAIREAQVARMRNKVAARQADATANLERKEELEAAAKRQADAVSVLVVVRRVAKRRAESAKQADLAQIRRLEDERARVAGMLQRLAARQHPDPSHAAPRQGGWLGWPVSNSAVTSPFGMRLHPILQVYKLHDGVDLLAGCGQPVYAAAAGRVVSEYYDGAYGNRIIVTHGQVNDVAVATSYNHLYRATVRSGESVNKGQLIGYAGTTGYSTGCHLHFMLYENGVAQDPVDEL